MFPWESAAICGIWEFPALLEMFTVGENGTSACAVSAEIASTKLRIPTSRMDFGTLTPNRIIGHPLHLVSFESATWRVGFQSAPVVNFRPLRGSLPCLTCLKDPGGSGHLKVTPRARVL